MDAELRGVGKHPYVPCREHAEHSPECPVGVIVRLCSAWDVQLGTCPETKRSSSLAEQACVESHSNIREVVGMRTQID